MPVAALIAGPGERTYLEQIRPLYGLFDVDGSIVWPRASFTILDPRSVRAADKAGIPLADLFIGEDHLRSRLAAASFPPEIGDALGRLESTLESAFEDAAAALAALDPTLAGSLRADKGKALHAVDVIRARALRVHKTRTERDTARIVAASHFLLPEGSAHGTSLRCGCRIYSSGPEGGELAMMSSPPRISPAGGGGMWVPAAWGGKSPFQRQPPQSPGGGLENRIRPHDGCFDNFFYRFGSLENRINNLPNGKRKSSTGGLRGLPFHASPNTISHPALFFFFSDPIRPR